MIKVQHIQVKKEKKTILQDISFEIAPGKMVVAIGRNGAGKSTLLETMTGSNAISKGEITWDGQQMEKMNLRDLANRRAVLSQQISVNFPIRVSELVEMGTYVSSQLRSQAEIDQIVYEALHKVDMLSFSERPFNTLSGGEKTRVLLAKCLAQLHTAHTPSAHQYLFLDEPTASLDIEQQFNMLALVRELTQEMNLGVFAVLHDINLAAQFGDEIILLKAGKIHFSGKPKQVLSSENLQEVLGIHAIVQTHPIYNCPHIISLPGNSKVFLATANL